MAKKTGGCDAAGEKESDRLVPEPRAPQVLRSIPAIRLVMMGQRVPTAVAGFEACIDRGLGP